MILIKNYEEPVELWIPKKIDYTFYHRLTLTSELTKKVYAFDFEDNGGKSDYYVAEFDFSNMPEGEYRYDVDNLDFGLLAIGKSRVVKKEYQSNNEYVQYIAE